MNQSCLVTIMILTVTFQELLEHRSNVIRGAGKNPDMGHFQSIIMCS